MVGFPGETEEDFEDTCKVIREVGFSHVHTFKYSIRQGTRAERMPDQVPEKMKQQRSLDRSRNSFGKQTAIPAIVYW